MNMALIGTTRIRARRTFAQTRSTDAGHYYQPSKPEYVVEFAGFVAKWRGDTEHFSSATDIIKHPAFQAIVYMGRKAIPLILSELNRHPDSLVAALPLITVENPVLEDDEGDVIAMISAWEAWVQSHPDD